MQISTSSMGLTRLAAQSVKPVSVSVRFQGEEPAPQVPQQQESSRLRKILLTTLFGVLGTSGLWMGIGQYRNHQQQKQTDVIAAQVKAQELAKMESELDTRATQQLTEMVDSRILQRRQATVHTPFCDVKDSGFVDFDADMDWQVLPDGAMQKDMKKFFGNEVQRWVWEVSRYQNNDAAQLAERLKDKGAPVLPLETWNWILDNSQSNMGSHMSGWQFHMSNALDAHATRFLKKHTLQEFAQQPELVKQFQNEFLNGGIDFEGKQVPGFREVLAEQGVQLHSIKLKELKLANDKIILPLGNSQP